MKRNVYSLALFALGLVSLPIFAQEQQPDRVAVTPEGATYGAAKRQARAEIKWTRPICVEDGRYIGWPTVCRLTNGDLMAVFSGDRDEHVCPWGKVQMIRSSDNGETWSAPRTIANGPIDDRDAGIVQLPDGEILVVYFTSVAYRDGLYSKEWPAGSARYWWRRHDEKIPAETRTRALGNFCVRSKDNGVTWSAPDVIPLKGQTPHGPVLLKNGDLFQIGRWTATAHDGAGEAGKTYISAERSSDGGHTWNLLCDKIPAAEGENAVPSRFHEPHIAELADGTLVVHVRYHGPDGHLRQTLSRDGGKSWTTMTQIPLLGLPPHLLVLPDGKLVSVYGRRWAKPGFGEFACISDDGGQTWDVSSEIVLAPSHCGDLGYPASTLLPDGDILTVYYQQCKPGEKPCLMATRWRVTR